jgi:hypothetical protein
MARIRIKKINIMPRSTISPKEFIKENYTSMTQKELAEALGISTPAVSVHCERLGIKPVTRVEKTIQFIKDHPEWRAEKIAETLGYHPSALKRLIKDHKLREPKRNILAISSYKSKIKTVVVQQGEQPAEKEPTHEDLIKMWEERSAKIKQARKGYTVYNQTHSPFGFADELRGIRTK